MTDLRDDIRDALDREIIRHNLVVMSEQLEHLVDAACSVFLERVAKTLRELHRTLAPSIGGSTDTVSEDLANHCTPETLLRYCDRMYPQSSRQQLAAHVEAWIRDRDALMLYQDPR